MVFYLKSRLLNYTLVVNWGLTERLNGTTLFRTTWRVDRTAIVLVSTQH